MDINKEGLINLAISSKMTSKSTKGMGKNY